MPPRFSLYICFLILKRVTILGLFLGPPPHFGACYYTVNKILHAIHTRNTRRCKQRAIMTELRNRIWCYDLLWQCFFIVSLHSGPSSRASSVYSKTPMYGSQTPMYGSQTPMHGSRTPMYGSQTPTHGDGKTKTICLFFLQVGHIRSHVIELNFFSHHRKSHTSLWFHDTFPRSFTHPASWRSLGSNTAKYSCTQWGLWLQLWHVNPLTWGK